MENKKAILTEPLNIELIDCEVPEITPDQVLIRVEYCGICGSDVHYYKDGKIGRTVVKFPFVLGHECAGEVVAAGTSVSGFAVGDKVVVEPGVGCGQCEYCKTGRYNLCEKMVFMATPPYHGAFQNYIAYPARGCHKLPAQVSTLEGAMIEPLAVGMYAAKRGEADCSKTVLITGAGCIGLMTLLSCKAMNAQKIIVSDIFQNRLDKAAELGADHVINAGKENIVERVRELTGGKGADIVFETAGTPGTMSQAVYLVRRGGVIVQVGTTAEPVQYQFNELVKIEADIRTVFRYRNIFPLLIELLAKGDIDLKAIDPDQFSFDRIAEAFDTAANKGSEVIKCMIRFD